ncbi:MAG: hypothetical protein OXF02_06320 [Simkaniaceae bacterium]|nr:hypothetical protein [Simkaniaceae bacterium]
MSTKVIERSPYPLYERVESDDMQTVRKTDDEMRELLASRTEPTIGVKEWLFAIWTVCSFAMIVALCIGALLRFGFGVHCFDWLMHPAVLVPLSISSVVLNRYFVSD